MTERVRTLRADAILVAAKDKLDLSISPSEAFLLAAGPSLNVVLDRLAARLEVRRSIPGNHRRDENDFQRRLAIAEVAAMVGGGFDSAHRHELIQELVEREASLRAAEDALESVAESVQGILADIQGESSEFGRFARYAYRLYSEQRAAIDAAVVDDDERLDSLRRLDDVYMKYVQEASQLS